MHSLYPPCRPSYLDILDSGCSQHFLQNIHPSTENKQLATPISVTLPNGTTLTATHSTNLQLKNMPESATHALILPTLQQYSLLSISQFCAVGCIDTFTNSKVTITHKNSIILTGIKSSKDGLYYTALPGTSNNSHPPPTLNMQQSAINSLSNLISHSPKELINLYHATCFSPNKNTWIEAIRKGFFIGWPGLTTKAVQQHLTQSVPSTKGHMKQAPKNYRPTNSINHLATTNDQPTSTFKVLHFSGQTYSDLTGRFPVQSSSGNNYLLVFFHVDSNAILVEPLKI